MSEVTSNQNTAESSADEKKGFGAVLKAGREALGISLGDMAARSRLSVAQIVALEEERVEELPAPVYVRAFIRDISGYLNIDPAPLVENYVSRFGGGVDTLGVVPDHDPANEVVIGNRPGKSKMKIFAVALVATVIALGCWGVYSELLAPDEKVVSDVVIKKAEEKALPADTAAVPKMKTEASDDEKALQANKVTVVDTLPNQDVAEKKESAALRTIKTKLTMSGDCWLQIRTPKGKNLIARDCKAGESFSFDVPAGTLFNLGNADAVVMTIDGKPFDLEKKSNRGIAHFTVK